MIREPYHPAEPGQPITAIIAVRRNGPDTWYVRRSLAMANYPGVWSLPSIQYDPSTFVNPHDLETAGAILRRLSAQRLGGVPLVPTRFVVEGMSDANQMGVDVTLRLYEVDAPIDPVLDTSFYAESEWMSAARYEEASAGQPCGLCVRLWSDHAWLSGITDRPFIATDAG